jgi:hypothetical protein
MTDVWSILKSLLFSSLMISQSALDILIYYPHSSQPPPFTSSIAHSVLRILIHLSFIIFKIGGISSTSSVAELKRCFFTAVDCLSLDSEECNNFVINLCQEVTSGSNILAQ